MKNFLGYTTHNSDTSKLEVLVYEDNNGCIGQANANKRMRKARHYLIALTKLNETCQSGQIHLFRIQVITPQTSSRWALEVTNTRSLVQNPKDATYHSYTSLVK